MSKRHQVRRSKAAMEAAAAQRTPCYVRRESSSHPEDKKPPLCKVHRQGKISVATISTITLHIKVMRKSAWETVRLASDHPAEVFKPHTVYSAALQRHIIAVGGAARSLDDIHCKVLDEIDANIPWAGIKRSRDALSHGIDPEDVEPHLLRERVGSYLPFLAGLPAIIIYDRPTQWKGMQVLPTDMDLVMSMHKNQGNQITLKYLAFLVTGECYSSTHRSNLPNRLISLFNKETGEYVADAFCGVTEAATDVYPVVPFGKLDDSSAEELRASYVVARTPPTPLLISRPTRNRQQNRARNSIMPTPPQKA